MSYSIKVKKSNKAQDVLAITFYIFIILNSIGNFVDEKYILPIAVFVGVLYMCLGKVEKIKKDWKNEFLSKLFMNLDNPSSAELIIGVFALLFGTVTSSFLGLDIPDFAASIFLIYYLLRTLFLATR